VGSIYLAAILLKLGGFGLIKLSSLLATSNFITTLLRGVSLWGVAYIRGLCIIVIDMKVLIAFSSVAHIRVGVIAGVRGSKPGVIVLLIVLVRHGVRSSMMFLQRYLIYTKARSRRVVIRKRRDAFLGLWSLFWVVRVLGIIGAPPSFNL